MTDHFALFAEARRPWLDPEELKEKYHALSRSAPPGAELNEAFRVLRDPKLRLHHLLMLEGANMTAGRPVPASVAELFWETGKIVREAEGWQRRNAEATSHLARAILHPARVKLATNLAGMEAQLRATLERELARLRGLDAEWNPESPNDIPKLIELYDIISYLTRLLERVTEQRHQLETA